MQGSLCDNHILPPSLARIVELSLCCTLALTAHAQTTLGLIAGRVVNVRDGKAIPGAMVRYTQLEITNTGVRAVSHEGQFALPLLPPGTYRIRVEAADFQAQELYELKLSVAGTLDLVFKLRPLKDVWEQRERHNIFLPGNSILVFFGPDVDLSRTASVEYNPGRSGVLESTLSQVVDSILIRDLPLAGRDVYAALATQPAVASDAATSRGLGLSVNGQRPSSTNFLLDGLENNNYLLSGPLTVVAPEAIQEYRVSTNNFSAEYGRTSGVVANAVTRSGGAAWHGMGYLYVKNDWLNANDFQRNAAPSPRTPLKEFQPGFFVGGPLKAKTLFVSAALDRLRFRSRTDQQSILVPSVQFLGQLKSDGVTAEMFRKYPPPRVDGAGPCVLGQATQQGGCSGTVKRSPTSSLDQTLGLGRVDRLFREGERRLMFRTIVSRVTRPDFSWSPYPDFTSALIQNATGFALTGIDSARPGVTLEGRIGWNSGELRFDRANSQIPGLAGPSGLELPGSPLFYSYRDRTHNLESVGNLMLTRGKHILKTGGGFLARAIDGYQTTGQEGYYTFLTLDKLAADQPYSALVSVPRNGPAQVAPDYNRAYRYNQWFGFFQGTWRIATRFSLNYGVRYENFGVPVNVGPAKDTLVALGSGTLVSALKTASGFIVPASGDERLYDPDRRDWAGRVGFAYSFFESGRTVLRGAYGIFYDRPFDNLWETIRHNGLQSAAVIFNNQTVNYLESVRAMPGALDRVSAANRDEIFPSVTLFQPGLRTPYVESYFLGVRQIITPRLSLEVSALGSLGRELITTDIVNRSLAAVTAKLPDVSYRSNQGRSDYSAGTAVLSWRGHRDYWQASYTWSHAIDNQSDALAGEFTDLGPVSAPTLFTGRAAFSRQFDSRVDRGNSSFDQRHSFVALVVLDLPSALQNSKAAVLFKDWKVSWLAAVRSGFPFTVFANQFIDPAIINQRANVVNPSNVYSGTKVKGGQQLLNRAAFAQPTNGEVGNSGRNAFQSPGFWNVDFSLSRTLRVRRLGEAGRLVFRADAFNLFNHANLGSPDSNISHANFGVALYGRQGYDTGFVAVTPFRETARQMQMMLRVEF